MAKKAKRRKERLDAPPRGKDRSLKFEELEHDCEAILGAMAIQDRDGLFARFTRREIREFFALYGQVVAQRRHRVGLRVALTRKRLELVDRLLKRLAEPRSVDGQPCLPLFGGG